MEKTNKSNDKTLNAVSEETTPSKLDKVKTFFLSNADKILMVTGGLVVAFSLGRKFEQTLLIDAAASPATCPLEDNEQEDFEDFEALEED